MDTVYLLALEIFLGVFILHFFPQPYGVLITIFLVTTVGLALEKKNFFYWVIPAVFLISFLLRTDTQNYERGDSLSRIEVRIYEGKGEIIKIEGRFPKKKSVVILEKIKNGEYKIDGEIEKKNERDREIIYYIKPEKILNMNEGYFKIKFRELNMNLLKNSQNDEKNLFLAVISGERESIYPRIKNLFVVNGVSHILAISGMHLGILLILMEFILKKTKLYKRERNILLLLGITIYFISVRNSPSLERAYIMAVIYLLGNIVSENSDNLKSLALAFIIGIIWKPTVYNELSFILSYWSMVIIFTLIPIQKKITEIIKERFQVQNSYLSRGILSVGNYIFFTFFLQLGIAPLIYYILGNFSLKSILLSILITPIGTIYIILCFLSLIFHIMPLTNMWYNLLIKSMEFFH